MFGVNWIKLISRVIFLGISLLLWACSATPALKTEQPSIQLPTATVKVQPRVMPTAKIATATVVPAPVVGTEESTKTSAQAGPPTQTAQPTLSQQQTQPTLEANLTRFPGSQKGIILKSKMFPEDKIKIWKTIDETEVLGELSPNTPVVVLDSAIRPDGKPFYQIQVGDLQGWVVQALVQVTP
jgi:hypothetical protein